MGAKSILPWWPKAWNPFTRWTSASASDYDTVLATLTEEIETVEVTLMDIKARKQRAIRSVLQGMLTLWLGAIGVMWGVAWVHGNSSGQRTLSVLLLLFGTPVFVMVLHRVVSMWFRRLEKAQETHLFALRTQRRTKINEIKKATDFDHLRCLLEQYDTNPAAGAQDKETHGADASEAGDAEPLTRLLRMPSLDMLNRRRSVRAGGAKGTETRAPPPPPPPAAPAAAAAAAPASLPPGASSSSTHTGAQTPAAGKPRGWMDRVADLLLGTDPGGATLEDQQYALICRNCLRHNGLVPKQELQEIEYICRYCNAFNSRRPSSRPVSSPFAGQGTWTSGSDTQTTDTAAAAPGLRAEGAPPPQPAAAAHGTAYPVTDTDTAGRRARDAGVRRSTRLRSTEPTGANGDDDMLVDE
ncbi:hypothetical protein MSPP1_000913 [Malassezia sp. CBS 17886]|nr:hypothetical protein MSPP1_000913 [Malassezia sp. CBS 17886]